MSSKSRNVLANLLLLFAVLVGSAIAWYAMDLRRLQQAELEEARTLIETIGETNTATIGTDLHGIITVWNPAAEKLTGYPADEVLGWGLKFLIPDDSQDSHRSGIAAAAQRGRLSRPVQLVKCSIRHKEGYEIKVILQLRMKASGGTRFLAQMNRADDVFEIDNGQFIESTL